MWLYCMHLHFLLSIALWEPPASIFLSSDCILLLVNDFFKFRRGQNCKQLFGLMGLFEKYHVLWYSTAIAYSPPSISSRLPVSSIKMRLVMHQYLCPYWSQSKCLGREIRNSVKILRTKKKTCSWQLTG